VLVLSTATVKSPCTKDEFTGPGKQSPAPSESFCSRSSHLRKSGASLVFLSLSVPVLSPTPNPTLSRLTLHNYIRHPSPRTPPPGPDPTRQALTGPSRPLWVLAPFQAASRYPLRGPQPRQHLSARSTSCQHFPSLGNTHAPNPATRLQPAEPGHCYAQAGHPDALLQADPGAHPTKRWAQARPIHTIRARKLGPEPRAGPGCAARRP
jgi:hypothetical protein